MKSTICIIICFLLFVGFVFAQKNLVDTNIKEKCVLAESIAIEIKSNLYKSNVSIEEQIQLLLRSTNSDLITRDLCVYARIFESWVKNANQDYKKIKNVIVTNDMIVSTDTNKNQLIQEFKRKFEATRPIEEFGGVIPAEMQEIACRHETNAMACLQRIAMAKLPQDLGLPTCARIKSRYQNPAAEAWVALSTPAGLSDSQKKTWLDNFIKSEKMQGKDGKKWAVEAAERMLRKQEKAGLMTVGTSNEIKNVRSE